MVGEIYRSYKSLRVQARKALRAKSTKVIIACYQPSELRTKYLYLHPRLWSIGGPRPARRGMLEIALPRADDPEPLQTLAVRADCRLKDWLQDLAAELNMRERKTLVRLVAGLSTLEEGMTGTRARAAG